MIKMLIVIIKQKTEESSISSGQKSGYIKMKIKKNTSQKDRCSAAEKTDSALFYIHILRNVCKRKLQFKFSVTGFTQSHKLFNYNLLHLSNKTIVEKPVKDSINKLYVTTHFWIAKESAHKV